MVCDVVGNEKVHSSAEDGFVLQNFAMLSTPDLPPKTPILGHLATHFLSRSKFRVATQEIMVYKVVGTAKVHPFANYGFVFFPPFFLKMHVFC